ncbi:dihydroxyacetone kinase subunit L [Streptomyces sp. ICC1]|nr:dihydroxyacetone kinase subunit L [Streptomyces sp. ICC4]AWZ16492.1 dihydroxyacetone kinase subunit L [Streptomyces sp. ICC1]
MTTMTTMPTTPATTPTTPSARSAPSAAHPALDTAYFSRWIAETNRLVRRDSARLTELDAVIGDGDHGANLVRGFGAVGAAVAEQRPATPGALLTLAGTTLTNTVGGASGPLFGTALRRTGKVLGDTEVPTAAELGAALGAGLRSVQKLGGAELGDATLVDALAPAVKALSEAAGADRPLREALDEAAAAARAGADATEGLEARKGRASYLGERSVGHQDAGANSVALLMEALRSAVDAAGAELAPGEPAVEPVVTAAPADRPAPKTRTGRVGVVLVSHSKAVAESVAALSGALIGSVEPAPLAVAGGTPDGGIGTSAELITAAARSVDEGQGVAVLCDMGSAVLTVKSLLGEEPSQLPEGARIVDAPFLEGAVAITLTSAIGGDLDAVLAAAEDARGYRKR